MSMAEILTTVDAALRDGSVGLVARVTALAPADARILRAFAFVPWSLDNGGIRDARIPNVMLRPVRWLPEPKRQDTGHRDADAQVQVGYEYFGTVAADIQDNTAILATALAQVADALPDYVAAHGGTIYEVQDPIDYDFGQFAGPTSHGFLATITLKERSTQ